MPEQQLLELKEVSKTFSRSGLGMAGRRTVQALDRVSLSIPGKPQVFMPYAGGMAHYRKICAKVAAHNYQGFKLRA